MNIFKQDKTISSIFELMKEYELTPAVQKEYALRASKKRTSKIKRLKPQESETLHNEMRLWTKQYIIDNIYKLLFDAAAIKSQDQNLKNEMDIKRVYKAFYPTVPNVFFTENVRLINVKYIELLFLAEKAGEIYLLRSSRLN